MSDTKFSGASLWKNLKFVGRHRAWDSSGWGKEEAEIFDGMITRLRLELQ